MQEHLDFFDVSVLCVSLCRGNFIGTADSARAATTDLRQAQRGLVAVCQAARIACLNELWRVG